MELTKFLETSYTAYQAVDNSLDALKEAGFSPLTRGKIEVEKGGKYYLTVNDSAFIAISVGQDENCLNIACAHTDSPCLKVKGDALFQRKEGSRINVETYGGLLLYSMLDIPLKIAGRAFIKSENGIKSENVVSSFNVNIPSLCIHHNREANDGLKLSVQNDMLPLTEKSDSLYSSLGLKDVLDADLYVVPDVKPFIAAGNLCSPRIDNLTSVYSCVQGIIEAKPKGIAVAVCFDNEEIGSGTKQGAASNILKEVLEGVYSSLGKTSSDLSFALSNGLLLSVDNAHAHHPAHPEKGDPLNFVSLNGGIVIKHHTNYATDGRAAAILKRILSDEGILYQDYYNNSDVRCGGTLGLIASRQLVMRAVDIGLAQLSMHSAVETVGADDLERMTRCITSVFDKVIESDGERIN